MILMDAIRALIMAGGKSERMRATAGTMHKALTRVHGMTLLEWNLRAIISYGFRDIVVAVGSHEPELEEYVLTSAAEIADRHGTLLTLYEESEPLGNVGAAREVIGDNDDLLMVYVDNLAAIDLRSLLDFHRSGPFALTIASHLESFQMPFGQLLISNDCITSYTEKPTFQVQVSSGTCVLAKRACELIPQAAPIGASLLFKTLSEHGEHVAAYRHSAPWIDVNDASALERAQTLVQDNLAAFELLRTG